MPTFDDTDRSSPDWAERLTKAMADARVDNEVLANVDAQNAELRKRIAELEALGSE